MRWFGGASNGSSRDLGNVGTPVYGRFRRRRYYGPAFMPVDVGCALLWFMSAAFTRLLPVRRQRSPVNRADIPTEKQKYGDCPCEPA